MATDIRADRGGSLGDIEAFALRHRLLGNNFLALRRIIRIHEGCRVDETDFAGETPLHNFLCENTTDIAATDETDFLEHPNLLLSLPAHSAKNRRGAPGV